MRARDATAADRAALYALIRQPDVFEPRDIRVAEELIDAHFSGSPDYLIGVADDVLDADASRTGAAGLVCYGHNPVTDAVYDVYWIAVQPDARRRGIGRALLDFVEERVRELAGRAVTIETSSQPEYRGACGLYEACGYARVAEIPDLYKPGDSMRVYMKSVGGIEKK